PNRPTNRGILWGHSCSGTVTDPSPLPLEQELQHLPVWADKATIWDHLDPKRNPKRTPSALHRSSVATPRQVHHRFELCDLVTRIGNIPRCKTPSCPYGGRLLHPH